MQLVAWLCAGCRRRVWWRAVSWCGITGQQAHAIHRTCYTVPTHPALHLTLLLCIPMLDVCRCGRPGTSPIHVQRGRGNRAANARAACCGPRRLRRQRLKTHSWRSSGESGSTNRLGGMHSQIELLIERCCRSSSSSAALLSGRGAEGPLPSWKKQAGRQLLARACAPT